MKKELTTLLLAIAAMTTSMTNGEENNTNVMDRAKETIKIEKKTIPSWIPTTIDGKFDRNGAFRQAQILWQENGKDIQFYADEIKSGVSEELAYMNLVKKLAKGDKKTEKQILALYDTVKETRQERNNKMTEGFIQH